MNLNIQTLLEDLKKNSEEILATIDQDPQLVKRTCELTGLTIANAAKTLFTPEKQHQLYAKGIVYKKTLTPVRAENSVGLAPQLKADYELVSLPLLKVYNHGENQLVDRHVLEMLGMGCEPVFFHKLDGTLITRTVVHGRVVLSTRGMLETMQNITDDDDGNPGKFFAWAYHIIDEKYPILRNPKFAPESSLMFELVGPQNQIVTRYEDWDLVFLALRDSSGYATRNTLASVAQVARLTLAPVYELPGETLLERIQALNALLDGTDAEGTMIQFEKDGVVHGRVKAKTETYRTLMKIMTYCTYDAVVEMIQKEPACSTLEGFLEHLKTLGRDKFPEELLDAYVAHWQAYADHKARCVKFIDQVVSECDRLFRTLKVRDYTKGLSREQRKEFALEASKRSHPGAYFAFIDGKLDVKFVMDRLLKTPEDSLASLSMVA